MTEKTSPHDPLLEGKLKELKEDMSVGEFMDVYFPGKKYSNLRDIIFGWLQGYDAADPYRASAFSLRGELTDEKEWEQMNIKEGYGSLVRFLEREVRKNAGDIYLKKEVKAIDLTGDILSVCSLDGTVYNANKIIITVPLPLLQGIVFTPSLPKKMEAASKIGFGGVIKILLRFRTKWWAGAREKNFEKLFFMFSNEAIPTWWTQYPEPHTTLTGWIAGPKAKSLADRSDTEIIDLALISLGNIFKIDKKILQDELIASKVANWVSDPFARGAYSYATPESEEAIIELREPVKDCLFFAGEALCSGSETATVEGALASGEEVANRILNVI